MKTKWIALAIGGALLARAVSRRLNQYDLRGKVVLITGGSRGLGLVMARQFAQAGAKLAICARDQVELMRARGELIQYGSDVLTLPCDVTDQNEVDSMVQQIERYYGRIDVLVNNAGVIQVGPIETMTLADFQEAMQTHYWAMLYTILAVLPGMKARREGRIVNITSIGGKISVPHLVPYSASKFAQVGLSAGLRAELAKDNIAVTTICPGLMRTGSPRNATFKGQHRAEYAWFSISDALPVSSIAAESAAARIITACRRGEAEVTLSLPAKLAARFQGLFPGLTADLLALVNRLLPAAGGIGKARATGKESRSKFSPSWLTALNERAAVRNNEVAR